MTVCREDCSFCKPWVRCIPFTAEAGHLFSLFFKIKTACSARSINFSFLFSHLKAKCLHLMFYFLDRIHRKEFNFLLSCITPSCFFISPVPSRRFRAAFPWNRYDLPCGYIPFFPFHALLFQKPSNALILSCSRSGSFYFGISTLFSSIYISSFPRMLPKNVQQHHTKYFLLAFPWFCRHQAVQLRVLRKLFSNGTRFPEQRISPFPAPTLVI